MRKSGDDKPGGLRHSSVKDHASWVVKMQHGKATSGICSNYVREWRKNAGLYLKVLADDVGSSVANLSNIEAGRTRLTGDMAERIAKRLGTTVERLRTGPPETAASMEARLLGHFRRAKENHRRAMLAAVEAIAGLDQGEDKPP